MARYRYYATELLPDANGHRKIRAIVPLSGVDWSVAWNAPGGMSAGIDLRSPKATRAILDPGRTAVFVERAGQIKWGGILVTATPSDTYQARLYCLGFQAWLQGFESGHGRFITSDLDFDGVGQCDIARSLVTYAQDEALHGPGADLGIGVPAGPAGKIRERTTWHRWSKKNIGEALVDLGNVIDGITFRFVHYWTGSGEDRRIATDFLVTDGVGRRLPHVFALGRNIRSITLPIGASRFASRAHMLGDGSEADQVQTTVSKTVAGYPLLEAVDASHGTVTQLSTLAGHGQDVLERRGRVQVLPSIVVKPGPDPQLSSYLPGEEVRVVASLARTQHATGVQVVEPVLDSGGETITDETDDPFTATVPGSEVRQIGAPEGGLLEVDGYYRLAAYSVSVGDVDAGHDADEDVTIQLMEA